MAFQGKRMRQRRLMLNMTQGELAKLAGLSSHGDVSDMENGRQTPSAQTLANIAWALAVSMDQLMTPNKKGGVERTAARKVRVFEWPAADARMNPALRVVKDD